MILGFKEESLESINDVYKGSNDLLNSINDIFELCKNAYRSEDINKNYSTLMDNYKKTLKTI